MTTAVREILKRIDRLTDREQKNLVAAILRRVNRMECPALTEEEITGIADERFLELDAAEEAHEKPKTRRSMAGRPRLGRKNSSLPGGKHRS